MAIASASSRSWLHSTPNSSPPRRAVRSRGRSTPFDAAGDLGQHVVAGPVAVVVVDGFEAVEVEVEHGHEVAVAVQLAAEVAEELRLGWAGRSARRGGRRAAAGRGCRAAPRPGSESRPMRSIGHLIAG